MLVTSEAINEISLALFEAQKDMGGVVRGKDNDFFSSKYADLAAVLKVLKPVYNDHGLIAIQFPIDDGERIGAVTRIIHSASGQWMESSYTLPIKKQDPQAAGSAITYARRYALVSMALMPSVDDDAEAASLREEKPITEEQVLALAELCTATGTQTEAFLKHIKVESFEELPASMFDKALNLLKKKAEVLEAAKAKEAEQAKEETSDE